MDRVIKFRAFNKVSEIMYYPEATPGNYNHYLQVSTEGFWLYNKDGRLICTSVNGDVLMQFAEFKDKNEKDIYEGDIVKFHYFYQSLGSNLGVQESEHELIGVVKWGAFGWAISAIKGQHWEGYTGYKSGEGESYIVDLYSMNESSIHEESFEVLGNIHEHPHLLNPAKGAVTHTMNTDPNLQAAESTNEQATTEQVAAVEQEAQEQAMESAEEGGTEG